MEDESMHDNPDKCMDCGNADGQAVGCCDTRYPIMLVHGTLVNDRRKTRCWGRIPGVLAARGARICFGGQDAWGSIRGNARQLCKSVDNALQTYGAEKVNIIAHSKGGLDARAMTALPGYAGKIASITTISTPHHGIKWVSGVWPFTAWLAAIVTWPFFPLWLLTGDKRPNLFMLLKGMTVRECQNFNSETPDVKGIRYQSYAGKMPKGSRNRIFYLSHVANNRFDGDNDGLIPVESAKWGTFCGTFTGGGKRGISHADEVDYFKRDYASGELVGDDQKEYADITQLYVRIASGLKGQGL